MAADADATVPRLGVVLQGPVVSLGESAVACEAAGAHSVWVGEYFQSALVRATVALGATSRVRVGTHVLQAFARSPLATALAAAELQQLGGGRFVLGLGSQLPEANRRWHAFHTDRPVADLGEYVAAVRALLAAAPGEPVRLAGPRWPLQVPGFRTDVAVPVAIGVGCARLGAVRLAARAGDEVLGHLLWSPTFVSRAADVLSEEGRSGMTVTVSRMVAPESVPGARLDAARALAHYAVTGAYSSLIDAAGIDLARDEVLHALRSGADDEIEQLAGPLLDAFCVEDEAGLLRHRRELAAVGVSEVVLVAPARRTEPAATERYERAVAVLVGSALH